MSAPLLSPSQLVSLQQRLALSLPNKTRQPVTCPVKKEMETKLDDHLLENPTLIVHRCHLAHHQGYANVGDVP